MSASVASDRSDAIRVSATGGDPDEVAELVNTYVATYVELRQSQRVDEILTAGNEIQAQIDRLQDEIDELVEPGRPRRRRPWPPTPTTTPWPPSSTG